MGKFVFGAIGLFLICGVIFVVGLAAGTTMKQPAQPKCPAHSAMQHGHGHHRG